MRTAAVIAVVVLSGCGGSEPSIDGNWAMDLNGACAVLFHFDRGERSYGTMLLCQTGPSSVGAELEDGDADFSRAGLVTGTPRRTSCLTSDHSVQTARYSFSGEQLVFGTDTGSLIMNRVKEMASTMTGAVSWGCWNMGSFEPHPIQNL